MIPSIGLLARVRHAFLAVILALSAPLADAAPKVTPAEAHVIAKEAYLYGYPMVENYRVMYAQAVERGGPRFLAPFDQISHTAHLYTAADAPPMADLDTAFSFAWLDLRAEPVVLTLPAAEAERYLSVQLVDLYTHNFDYLGTRTTGNAGGRFLIAGPAWKGNAPPGVVRALRAETQVVLALIRMQLLDAADLVNVQRLQAEMRLQPLSSFLGRPPAQPAPRLKFPAPAADLLTSAEFFDVLAFVLQLCPVQEVEQGVRTRFARVGLGPGQAFRMQALTPELRQAFTGGLRDAHTQLEARAALASRPGQMFGTREFFNGDYALRALGAKAGLYGSSREEALYPLYLADAQGEALDGRRRRYLLRFDPGGLPPVNAFWSLTLYDLPGQRLVPNPLNRHAIGSRALRDLKFDADGGLTIHIQAEPPGPEREVNWLPAPDGPFMLSMRLYWPKEQVLRGEWKPPAVQRVR